MIVGAESCLVAEVSSAGKARCRWLGRLILIRAVLLAGRYEPPWGTARKMIGTWRRGVRISCPWMTLGIVFGESVWGISR